MNPTQEIKALRESFQQAERDRASLEGRRDQLMERLNIEFEVDSIKGATALADDMEQTLGAKKKKLAGMLEELGKMQA